jgi:ABC-2 type transport system permease protein
MGLRPGSVLWLMRHELRLLYRGTTRRFRNLIWVVLVFAVFHLAAIPLASGAHIFADLSSVIPLLLVSGLLVLLGLTLAARSLTLAVQSLYERGDLDLLLSSPLDGRTLFSVRAGTLVVALCYELGVLVLPFANVFAAFGQLRWLCAYLALPLAAALALSGSLWLSLALVRWLGPRPTRLVAQILAGVVGICAATATQIPRLVSGRDSLEWLASPTLLARLPDAQNPVWIPARALMGDPLWTPLAAALCLGAFAWSVWRLGAEFIEGLATTAGVARKPIARSRGVRRFRSGMYTALARKELRLMLRDPWLVTQLLQQNLYLLPMMFVFARLKLHSLSCIWLVVVVCAGTTASAFAWLAASGEEAPELLGTAPIGARHLMLAQLSASVLPVLLAAAGCCALLAPRDPVAASVLFACSAGNALSNAVLHVRVKRPAKRQEFLRRNQHNLPLLLAELLFLAGWVGLAMLVLALV